jgi:hypothetical protein
VHQRRKHLQNPADADATERQARLTDRDAVHEDLLLDGAREGSDGLTREPCASTNTERTESFSRIQNSKRRGGKRGGEGGSTHRLGRRDRRRLRPAAAATAVAAGRRCRSGGGRGEEVRWGRKRSGVGAGGW